MEKPGLFGIRYSNRDFTQKNSWGKNQFNSSFPAALACYMSSQQLKANYIYLQDNSKIAHTEISIKELFRIDPTSENIFFAFENQYTPYQQFVVGNIPGIDLVIQDRKNGECLSGLEIKLTALR
ncbi:MAG: HindVP family restriction endonuclease [Microcoleaceae cyanobacterium]